MQFFKSCNDRLYVYIYVYYEIGIRYYTQHGFARLFRAYTCITIKNEITWKYCVRACVYMRVHCLYINIVLHRYFPVTNINIELL